MQCRSYKVIDVVRGSSLQLLHQHFSVLVQVIREDKNGYDILVAADKREEREHVF